MKRYIGLETTDRQHWDMLMPGWWCYPCLEEWRGMWTNPICVCLFSVLLCIYAGMLDILFFVLRW